MGEGAGRTGEGNPVVYSGVSSVNAEFSLIGGASLWRIEVSQSATPLRGNQSQKNE
jgi:hypothetical protein